MVKKADKYLLLNGMKEADLFTDKLNVYLIQTQTAFFLHTFFFAFSLKYILVFNMKTLIEYIEFIH